MGSKTLAFPLLKLVTDCCRDIDIGWFCQVLLFLSIQSLVENTKRIQAEARLWCSAHLSAGQRERLGLDDGAELLTCDFSTFPRTEVKPEQGNFLPSASFLVPALGHPLCWATHPQLPRTFPPWLLAPNPRWRGERAGQREEQGTIRAPLLKVQSQEGLQGLIPHMKPRRAQFAQGHCSRQPGPGTKGVPCTEALCPCGQATFWGPE